MSPTPYDPARPGPHPVATRSGVLVDAARADRRLPVSLWYPAPGAALDRFGPGVARLPLVVYSHSSYGRRTESASLLRHLASHGFVVAAVEHTGNTPGDLSDPAGPRPDPQSLAERVRRMIGDRVPDLRFVVSSLTEAPRPTIGRSAIARSSAAGRSWSSITAQIDTDRIGLVGWSFGGWAVLATPEADARIGAIVAMTPGGSSKPLPGIIPATLTFRWLRPAPTLVLAAEEDQYTPLDGVEEVFRRIPADRRLFVLRHADHDQFADRPVEDFVRRDLARRFTRSLTLAHLQAVLAGSGEAEAYLEERAERLLASSGVPLYRVADRGAARQLASEPEQG